MSRRSSPPIVSLDLSADERLKICKVKREAIDAKKQKHAEKMAKLKEEGKLLARKTTSNISAAQLRQQKRREKRLKHQQKHGLQ